MAKRKIKYRKGWIAAALVLWLAGILFPMAWASRVDPVWNEWFNRMFAPTWVHVVMHAGMYAVLVLGLSWLLEERVRKWQMWGIVLLVALMQEGLQLWGAARLPGWGEGFDLLVDMSGAGIGWMIWRILRGRQEDANDEVKT